MSESESARVHERARASASESESESERGDASAMQRPWRGWVGLTRRGPVQCAVPGGGGAGLARGGEGTPLVGRGRVVDRTHRIDCTRSRGAQPVAVPVVHV